MAGSHRMVGRVCVALLVPWIVATAGCGEHPEPGETHAPARPEVRLPAVCIGPEVPVDAWGADPGGDALPAVDAGASDVAPELGEPMPVWALEDFQPQSCGYEAVYGLDAFRGVVTVVAIWSGS